MCNKRTYLLENSKNILDNISVDDDLELVKSGNLMKAIKNNVCLGFVKWDDAHDYLSGKVISVDKIGNSGLSGAGSTYKSDLLSGLCIN